MHYTNVGLTVDNGYINLLELMRKDVANRFSVISYLLYVTRWNFMVFTMSSGALAWVWLPYND